MIGIKPEVQWRDRGKSSVLGTTCFLKSRDFFFKFPENFLNLAVRNNEIVNSGTGGQPSGAALPSVKMGTFTCFAQHTGMRDVFFKSS